MLRDMPFTGIGVNIFSVIQTNFYPGYIIGPEAHAHSLYLQTALDQGIPGLGAMLFMFFAWGITIKSNYDKATAPGQKILYIAMAAAMISFLITGLTDGMTLGAKPAPILWAFLGIGAAAGVRPTLAQQTSQKMKISWLKVITP